MRGWSELRALGFGPFFDNEDLVSGHTIDDSKHKHMHGFCLTTQSSGATHIRPVPKCKLLEITTVEMVTWWCSG